MTSLYPVISPQHLPGHAGLIPRSVTLRKREGAGKTHADEIYCYETVYADTCVGEPTIGSEPDLDNEMCTEHVEITCICLGIDCDGQDGDSGDSGDNGCPPRGCEPTSGGGGEEEEDDTGSTFSMSCDSRIERGAKLAALFR